MLSLKICLPLELKFCINLYKTTFLTIIGNLADNAAKKEVAGVLCSRHERNDRVKGWGKGLEIRQKTRARGRVARG